MQVPISASEAGLTGAFTRVLMSWYAQSADMRDDLIRHFAFPPGKAVIIHIPMDNFEGFPNTLAGAMAHGVPAVALDCGTAHGKSFVTRWMVCLFRRAI